METFTQQEGPHILNFDPKEATAAQYFELLIDLDFIDLLVTNTNAYTIWKQQQTWVWGPVGSLLLGDS